MVLAAAEVVSIFSDDFMERIDGWDLGDQILKLGGAATTVGAGTGAGTGPRRPKR